MPASKEEQLGTAQAAPAPHDLPTHAHHAGKGLLAPREHGGKATHLLAAPTQPVEAPEAVQGQDTAATAPAATAPAATPPSATPPAAAAPAPAPVPAAPGAQPKASGSDTATTHKRPAQVRLPLELNTKVDCRWRDGRLYNCRIVERRVREGASPDQPEAYEYYVHYKDFNRRMDEWVSATQFDLSSVEEEVPAEGAEGEKRGPKKRRVEENTEHDEEHGDFDPSALREHEEFTKVKNVHFVELGQFELETWYFSPLPPEFSGCEKLYFCEFSLHFFKRRNQLVRHLRKCKLKHPPGDEIYRNGNVSVFEIDGKKEKQYCQNLCYLAKLFLDHKTLYYDVDLFLFYVTCEVDAYGAHMVGYFSKEKCSEEGYNLACILTLPSYQRKGYGKFLISFSYELSKIEGKVGTPERPLSDLGLVSYRGYWTRVLLQALMEREGSISIKELSDETAIRPDDVMSTLQHHGLIQYQKGQHVIVAAPQLLQRLLKEAGSPGLQVDASKIVWTPYNAEREYQNYRG